jgi:branched-chain amino acid transport system permease protein
MTCGIHLHCGEILLQLLAIGLSNGAIIALNAIGVTLIYGAVRTVNFAYGDLFALTTLVVTTVITSIGLREGAPFWVVAGGLALALGAAMTFAVLLNVAVERAAFRPFRSGSRLAPLVATVGLSFILYQVAITWRTSLIIGPEHHSDVDNLANVPRSIIPELLPKINLVRAAGLSLDVTYTLKDLLVLLLAAIVAIVVTWFLRRTPLGRAVRACAQDAEMAMLCGVNRNGMVRMVFAIGGALAGASAFIFTLYYNRSFGQHGVQSGLIAFLAAVLGGIGSPAGAFLAGLLLGVLAALSDYFLAAQWTPVLVLGMLMIMLLLRPTGLSEEERGEELAPEPAAWGAIGAIRRVSAGSWLTGGLIILGLLYPVLDQALGFRVLSVITSMLLFALLALGLNILLGFAGLLDLGYAAIFGIGGYTAALLMGGNTGGRAPVDFLIVLAVSAAVAGLFGAANGALTFRLRGDYLAIVTLAFGQLVSQTFLNLDQWTGGKQGIAALPAPRLLVFSIQTPVQRYYLALVVLALVAIASVRLVNSRLGRAWAAISLDEAAAMSCGVPVRARMVAFVVGAVVAGGAGALFAGIFSYVGTDQSDFTITAMVLAMVIIGGAGSVRGAIIGAIVVTCYNQFVVSRIGGWWEQLGQASGGWLGRMVGRVSLHELSYFFFGLALYLTVLLRERRRTRDRAPAARGEPPIQPLATSDAP